MGMSLWNRKGNWTSAHRPPHETRRKESRVASDQSRDAARQSGRKSSRPPFECSAAGARPDVERPPALVQNGAGGIARSMIEGCEERPFLDLAQRIFGELRHDVQQGR